MFRAEWESSHWDSLQSYSICNEKKNPNVSYKLHLWRRTLTRYIVFHPSQSTFRKVSLTKIFQDTCPNNFWQDCLLSWTKPWNCVVWRGYRKNIWAFSMTSQYFKKTVLVRTRIVKSRVVLFLNYWCYISNYEWAKRKMFLLAVTGGSPWQHSNSSKTFKKNWKKWNKIV